MYSRRPKIRQNIASNKKNEEQAPGFDNIPAEVLRGDLIYAIIKTNNTYMERREITNKMARRCNKS